MAWSIPTYAGLYALGSPSNLRIGLFELMRAVNERETALGWVDDGSGFGGINGQLTRFYKADGTTGVNLTMADIEKLPCSGIGSYAYQNMSLINGFCANRCILFTAGATTIPYTQSSLEAAIGTTLDNPLRYNEARWWQSVQDALDLLVYPWGYMNFADSTATLFDYSGNESSIATAWANRHDNTEAVDTGAAPGGYATWQSFGQWAAGTQVDRTYRFQHDAIEYASTTGLFEPVGTIHNTLARYTTGAANLDTACDFDIDGNTVSVSAALGLTDIAVEPFTFASDNYITVTFSDPVSSPFTADGDPFTDTAARSVTLNAANDAKVYWDITAELTDQA